jgi:MFS transporter, DHA1 family, tetracycline resistance protein
VTDRARTWLANWGPIVPLLIAEGTIWVGFGALLPILAIYFTAHGVDLPTLGVVIAAWPAARLVGEPVFGWVADRASRKTMMVAGLLLAAAFAVMPLFAVGPLAFIVARLLAGLSASIYDPAARGYLVDANPPERQGETFGLYGAAQMGGLMIGPAVGGLAAAATGEPTVVFWVAGIALVLSAILVAARVADLPRGVHTPEEAQREPDAAVRPARILNTLLLAAIAFNVGSFFAGGSYEVIWSLYLSSLGAGPGAIGLTYFTFALPILVLSPVTGRFIDREGGFLAMTVGMAGVAICGALYPLVPAVWFVAALGLVEGTAFAFASPALYLLVARASPPGRSSTAQGLFGAAGTVGTIVASLSAGYLANIDLRYPFFASAIGSGVLLLVGLLLGRRALWDAMQPHHSRDGDPEATPAPGAEPASRSGG